MPDPKEIALRTALGVPPDAKQVIVFAQTSHLDIDWQKTFDDYYTSYVETAFLQASQLVQTQPRSFYSVAEMAYLSHHLDVHPEELAPLQAAAANGQLHIVGGGITSPDTLLPETEMLARDYLLGLKYAEDTIGVHPTAAWLPDSFGHSATTPDLLAAAGFDSVAFARADGAPTIFELIVHPKGLPVKPGSTAELLQTMGTADFFWKGAGGAKVFAHFMVAKGLYCMGDNLDYSEDLQTPGGHIGMFEGDDTSFTDKKIDGYLAEMMPYTKTTYVFVPVGCDFQPPKTQLISYLDGYNQRRYPTTGAWAVAAPFDDYVTLVRGHADVLPEIATDITPYFMGFYGSRADVKQETRRAARPFFLAETFATVLGDQGKSLVDASLPAMALLARADHHDFVTGTSTDDVVANEQLPLLADAESSGNALLASVANAISSRVPSVNGAVGRWMAFNASSEVRSELVELDVPTSLLPAHAVIQGQEVALTLQPPMGASTTTSASLLVQDLQPFSYQAVDIVPGALPDTAADVRLDLLDDLGNPTTLDKVTDVILTSTHVRAELRASPQFQLVSVQIDGEEAIAGPSFLLTDYTDTGGLWRMGNEMEGCVLTPIVSSPLADTVKLVDFGSTRMSVAFVSPTATRTVTLTTGATGLDLSVASGAATMTTRTLSFSLVASATASLVTSQPAGPVTRPLERVYTPTFWPAVEWAGVGDWSVLLRQSTGVRMSAPGQMELIVARNAPSEQCDVEGGTGTDDAIHTIEWRLAKTASQANASAQAQSFNRPIAMLATPLAPAATQDLPSEMRLFSTEGDGIITAFKPALRGNGLILRALLQSGPMTVHFDPSFLGRSVTSDDLAERDGASIGILADPFVIDASHGVLPTFRLQ